MSALVVVRLPRRRRRAAPACANGCRRWDGSARASTHLALLLDHPVPLCGSCAAEWPGWWAGSLDRSPATGRVHDATVRRRAVALVRHDGSTARSAAAIIATELGVSVHPSTVQRWADPHRAERRRALQAATARQQRASATGGRIGRSGIGPELKLARLQALLDLGLPAAKVARVMNLDFPEDELCEADVWHSLQTGRYIAALPTGAAS